MRVLLWGLFLFVGAVFIGYAVFSYLPQRGLLWENGAEATPETITFDTIKDAFSSLTKAEPITVAVLGMAGEGYQSGSLVDAIVVARVDPTTESVYLISVPRDLWIANGEQEYKINEIIHTDTVPNGLNTLENFTGLSIDGYVVVDLNTVEMAVDWMGGIDVTLEEPAVDWVSGYTLNAGDHHLSGEDAVWLLRNRYNRQGDFFREGNQQMVAVALWEAFMALPKEKKSEFLNTMVFTSDILEGIHIDIAVITPFLVGGLRDINTIQGIVLSPTTGLMKVDTVYPSGYETGISVVLPTAGFGEYGDIRAYIQEQIQSVAEQRIDVLE